MTRRSGPVAHQQLLELRAVVRMPVLPLHTAELIVGSVDGWDLLHIFGGARPDIVLWRHTPCGVLWDAYDPLVTPPEVCALCVGKVLS